MRLLAVLCAVIMIELAVAVPLKKLSYEDLAVIFVASEYLSPAYRGLSLS